MQDGKDALHTLVCKSLLTLFALGVNGNNSEAGAAEEFSLSRMLMSKGLKKLVRLARGVELSTADMRAAFALRLTTDGLMLRRSVRLDAFLGLGPEPVLLALGPAGHNTFGISRMADANSNHGRQVSKQSTADVGTHLGCSCRDVGTEGRLVQLGVHSRWQRCCGNRLCSQRAA